MINAIDYVCISDKNLTVSSHPYTKIVMMSLDANDLNESNNDLTTVVAIALVLNKKDN